MIRISVLLNNADLTLYLLDRLKISSMKLLIGTLLMTLVACTGVSEKKTAKDPGLGEDLPWIGDGRELPAHDSLFYLDDPAPLFRKEFKTDKLLAGARLFITAAGYYKASINGSGVGEDVDLPGPISVNGSIMRNTMYLICFKRMKTVLE